ncbi:MAG: hypothetical protein SGILL_009263 [Bacillariaceae sp.]
MTTPKRSGSSLLRTGWPIMAGLIGIFFLRSVMVSERSTTGIPQTTVMTQEQLMHKEQVSMLQDLIRNNDDPAKLATQLFRTKDTRELTKIATAIAQMEGPPFSDMDFTKLDDYCTKKKRCNCGVHKCFHGSHDNSLGYLVAGGSSRYSKMMAAYRREEFLINQYGIARMSVDAPYVVENVTEPMLEVLRVFGKQPYLPLVVQQVYKAPEPNLFVGAGNHKSQRTRDQIPRFAAQIAKAGKQALREFKQRFDKEVERCSKVVSDPNNLYLRHDWQAIIDSSGTIFYIDLDRGLENLEDYAKLRPNRIKEGMESIGKWLTTGMASNFTGLDNDDLFIYDDR